MRWVCLPAFLVLFAACNRSNSRPQPPRDSKPEPEAAKPEAVTRPQPEPAGREPPQKPQPEPAGPKPAAGPAFRLTAEELLEEFSIDPEEANRKYSGNVLEVIGPVLEAGPNSIVLGMEQTGMTVHAILEKAPASIPAKGTPVTILGICQGGHVSEGYRINVILTQAVLR